MKTLFTTAQFTVNVFIESLSHRAAILTYISLTVQENSMQLCSRHVRKCLDNVFRIFARILINFLMCSCSSLEGVKGIETKRKERDQEKEVHRCTLSIHLIWGTTASTHTTNTTDRRQAALTSCEMWRKEAVCDAPRGQPSGHAGRRRWCHRATARHHARDPSRQWTRLCACSEREGLNVEVTKKTGERKVRKKKVFKNIYICVCTLLTRCSCRHVGSLLTYSCKLKKKTAFAFYTPPISNFNHQLFLTPVFAVKILSWLLFTTLACWSFSATSLLHRILRLISSAVNAHFDSFQHSSFQKEQEKWRSQYFLYWMHVCQCHLWCQSVLLLRLLHFFFFCPRYLKKIFPSCWAFLVGVQ